MLGAIIGDIVGSRFEFNNHRSKEFELFTEECFDTPAAITGSVAEVYYGVPSWMREKALGFFDERLLIVI